MHLFKLEAQKLSSLECVRRHHSNGHIVSCGNDLGLLSIWDLRSQANNLHFISAHEHAITQLQYVFTENNSVISSSLDGQLLKWNFNSGNQLENVQCVNGSKGEAAIESFDLSVGGRIAFFTDLEALHIKSL
jgi:WD40 repeat protein